MGGLIRCAEYFGVHVEPADVRQLIKAGRLVEKQEGRQRYIYAIEYLSAVGDM
jgi:hypothetical protein